MYLYLVYAAFLIVFYSFDLYLKRREIRHAQRLLELIERLESKDKRLDKLLAQQIKPKDPTKIV